MVEAMSDLVQQIDEAIGRDPFGFGKAIGGKITGKAYRVVVELPDGKVGIGRWGNQTALELSKKDAERRGLRVLRVDSRDMSSLTPTVVPKSKIRWSGLKIKPEHCDVIYDSVAKAAEVADARNVTVDDYVAKKMGKNPYMRYRWDLLNAAKIEGNTSKWISDNIYPYANDSHIDTLLRRIFGHKK
jgi:hypothetical protein